MPGFVRFGCELQYDRRTFPAVVHSLQTLGEAARQMRKGFRESHPEIPRRETAGLQNVIAHEHFGLDIDIIWDVIQVQIAPLAKPLCKIQGD
ncbi:MAG TPA: HepT-like ribonuclease domain-containing protein [Anaerolineales bacterium]